MCYMVNVMVTKMAVQASTGDIGLCECVCLSSQKFYIQNVHYANEKKNDNPQIRHCLEAG